MKTSQQTFDELYSAMVREWAITGQSPETPMRPGGPQARLIAWASTNAAAVEEHEMRIRQKRVDAEREEMFSRRDDPALFGRV